MEKVIAVIFAGGSGVRMGAGKPKQFLEVAGRPIIIHTLEIFEMHPEVDEIVISCKEDYIEPLKRMLRRNDISKVSRIVPGGDTAMASIYNGLVAAKSGRAEDAAKSGNPEDAVVLVHDGVRPFVTRKLVSQVIAAVREHGSAATCTPLFETPVISHDGRTVEETPERSLCFTAQAPQGFRLDELLSAHETIRAERPDYKGIVDNCSLMKRLGREVTIVEGPRSNIKVTTPEDLYIFKAMLEYRETIDALGMDLK